MTPEAIRSLPQFDVVLCLSVLHHVIRAFGIVAAEQFLCALATRVNKVLVFEIGTADDTFQARQIVVATGPFQVPFVPPAAQGLEPAVTQVHSADRPSAGRAGGQCVRR